MYITLHYDIISVLDNIIGHILPEDTYRSGRIEYRKNLDRNLFVKTRLDEEEIKSFEIKNPEEYNPPIQLYVRRSYWIDENNIIVTNGFRFEATSNNLEVILRQIYYMTDHLGEPINEDLKTIEWDFAKGKKIVIILPKKTFKEFNAFSFIIGIKDFLDTSEVWKNGA